MPAGWFPACVRYGDKAGVDPIIPVNAPQSDAGPPAAVQFDPGARAYVYNPDGTSAVVDPVDAQVELLLGIEYGSVPNASTFGTKLRAVLDRVPEAKLATVAAQEVARVLAPLISAGKVQIDSVVVDVSLWKQGRLLVAISYFNLTVTPPPGVKRKSRTVSVS